LTSRSLPPVGESCAHPLQNGIGVERLLDKVTGARVDGRECFRCLVLSGYYDDPSRRRVQSFEHVCARTIGHEQVEENAVRLPLADRIDEIITAQICHDAVAFEPKDGFQGVTDSLIVFNYRNKAFQKGIPYLAASYLKLHIIV